MRLLLILTLVIHCLACRAADPPKFVDQAKLRAEYVVLLEQKAEVEGLTPGETGDLALNYFWLGRFTDALTVTKLSLGSAKERSQKAFLYLLKAQCEAALGRFSEASASATRGQRLSPQSQPLALLRVAYSDQAGNHAERTSAIDHLKRLDPNIPEPVMETKELLIMAQKIAFTAWIIWMKYGDEITVMASKAKAIGLEMMTAWQDIKNGRNMVIP